MKQSTLLPDMENAICEARHAATLAAMVMEDRGQGLPSEIYYAVYQARDRAEAVYQMMHDGLARGAIKFGAEV